jgi:hypothetical protein
VQARTKHHTLPRIVCFAKEGLRVRADEASNFKRLTEKYGHDHEMVDHSAKEYPRGDVHTNSIQSFWSQVRRGITGLAFGFEEELAALPTRVRVSL